MPDRAHGVNIGLSVLDPTGERAQVGRLYAEYQRGQRMLMGWAVGHGVGPTDGSHGPHVTAFFAGLAGPSS